MKLLLQKTAIVVVAFGALIAFLYLMPTGYALDGTVGAMEKAYHAQGVSLSSGMDAFCATEQALAAKKLEDHYSGKTVLNGGLDVLQAKAEGTGLTCRELFQ